MTLTESMTTNTALWKQFIEEQLLYTNSKYILKNVLSKKMQEYQINCSSDYLEAALTSI